VEYNATANTWKLSDESYNITTNGGKYYPVTVTEHPQDTTTVSGGLANLSDFQMTYGTSGSSQALNPSSNPIITLPYKYSFTPEYTTYVFDEGTHNYFNNGDQGTNVPANSGVIEANNPSYLWTISGDAVAYLSFASGSQLLTTTEAQPTLYYRVENTTGDKTATLKLTVTYNDGSKQTRTTTVTAKTSCQNPAKAADPAITDVGATVSWYPTAESYVVYWQKSGDGDVWSSVSVGNVTSYTITGLAFGSTYTYKVSAICGGDEMPNPIPYSFTTNTEPTGMIVYGAIFGGGRMANVTGKTEVEVVNGKSINTIYGGNDIAGQVLDADGSSITLGTAATTGNISIGSVYGGGNGYYTYDGHEPGVDIGTTYHANGQFSNSVTEVGGSEVYMTSGYIPSIIKTAITVANDYIIVDSIFGGAKNAFLTASSGNGSTVTINHGIVLAVFGGNNYGGTQGAAKQHVEVTGTKIPTTLSGSIVNTSTTGYGRDYGIRYLFGGGNKVKASTTEVVITGGLCDTVFAGGNSADVATAATLQLNCPIGEGAGNTFGSVYSDAIASYSTTDGVTIKTTGYAWDGFSGIYNVRALFGGNNKATMNVVPALTLTSGSVGTVYGGGNAGNMVKNQTGGAINFNSDPELDNLTFKYSTHVTLDNCPNLIADYVYGGCQMSDVLYSTWVEMKDGHVGTVYGGCNISGDVGSTHLHDGAASPSIEYQEVWGATYVEATGGIVYKDLFAGSNGYYHCSQDGIHYTSGSFSSNNYIGMTVPTHNVTHAVIRNGATIRGNVYAGGNLACVGFDDYMGTYGDRNYPELVGMASVRMDGGTVLGNVYGGGNMASIYGSNEVRVSGGTITLGLYGGNDCSGKVAEKTNRVLPDNYTVASDGVTSLTALGVKTYVGVKGNSQIGTVYGGGNGDYLPGSVQYCYDNFEPIQSFTFVDIHINGGTDGGHIRTVYGGGNGVTVRHGVTVFLNNTEPGSAYDFNNIDTIFGGNNKGDLNVTPDIYLVHGHVGTVYGGCNRGAMVGEGRDVGAYEDVGSYVRLLNQYTPNGTGTPVDVDAKVTNAVYGGCRMNGVTNNSLVLVEGGNHSAIPLFGGSDISGTVSGISRVAVTGGTVGNVYGGGNGYYTYSEGNVYTIPTSGDPVLVATGVTTPPNSVQSGVDMTSGTAANLYASGNACGSGATLSNISGGTVTSGVYSGSNTSGTVTGNVVLNVTGGTIGAIGVGNGASIFGGGYGESTMVAGNVTINFGENNNTHNENLRLYGDLYGGSALGSVNTNGSNTTTVNIYNGIIEGISSDIEHYGNVFGGGLGRKADGVNPPIAALVNGKVFVNIGSEEAGKASLIHCNVYGCNNQNGSPQDDVQVNVYNTNHTPQDAADYFESDRSYAIYQVFGGGNQAHYAPDGGNVNSDKRATVHVYDCENTVNYVYGGGNAADAVGVRTIVEGGRFSEIYGGGNGRVTAANIGLGGIGLGILAGNVGFLFEGSNKEGENYGETYDITGSTSCMGGLFVDSYFFGTNEAEHYGDLNNIITCAEAGDFEYRSVYAGSRWGIVYGDITLTVCGGIIENLFGGCRGYENYSADVRRFPTYAEITEDQSLLPAQRKYSAALLTHMGYDPANQSTFNTSLAHTGGNINLIVTGGTIGNVFGGCDIKGNVEGKISVTVVDAESTSCPLFVGDVYGASNLWYYHPVNSDITSPNVKILRGEIGGSNPNLPVNNTFGASATEYEGNVFGGGNFGEANANPQVIVGDDPSADVTINGNVYGGGNEGDITGSANVILVPNKHAFSYTVGDGGTVTVTDGQGHAVSSGTDIAEGIDLNLTARPDDYAHRFTGWTCSGTGASIASTSAASTVFTMGTDEASVTASFETVTPYTLTLTSPTNGIFTVTGANGSVTSGTSIGEGMVLNLVATPSPYGYKFKKWTVTGTGSSVANANAATTTFTMGTTDANIAAEFEEISEKYPLTITPPALGGSFTVKDYQNNTVSSGAVIGKGAVLYLEATPSTNYALSGWTVTGAGSSVANPVAATTTFTMGEEAASITAAFAETHTLTITPPASSDGTIRVTDGLGGVVNSGYKIGEGAKLKLKATPKAGKAFKQWTVSDTGSTFENANAPITVFTMGTDDATLAAEFITAHILTITDPDPNQGTIKVTGPLGQNITSPASVGENVVLTIVATQATNYHFVRWEVTGNGTIANVNEASSTFTMETGEGDATITAIFAAN